MSIKTSFIYPPIPNRHFDWQAVEDGYEPGCPVGYGQTEKAAVADLMEQLADASDDEPENKLVRDGGQFGMGA